MYIVIGSFFMIGVIAIIYGVASVIRAKVLDINHEKEMQRQKMLHKQYVKTEWSESEIFDVNKFNSWYCDKDNGAHYAHAGIFLRTDKLCVSQIKDYLRNYWKLDFVKYEELNDMGWSKDTEDRINDFREEIRKDWMNKLHK